MIKTLGHINLSLIYLIYFFKLQQHVLLCFIYNAIGSSKASTLSRHQKTFNDAVTF